MFRRENNFISYIFSKNQFSLFNILDFGVTINTCRGIIITFPREIKRKKYRHHFIVEMVMYI